MQDLITTPQVAPTHEAQAGLIEFVKARLNVLIQRRDDLQVAHEKAKKNKWDPKALGRAVTHAEKEMLYNAKLVAALEAGYVVMPPITCEVFAVRIDDSKRLPPAEERRDPGNWTHRFMPDISSNTPEIGAGRYVAPEVMFVSSDERRTGSDGKDHTYRIEEATDFIEEIPFPFIMAKPQTMDATQRAMALNLFDDLAISPSRGVRKADPIILGRIYGPKRGYTRRTAHFLIAWLVRPEDL